MRMKKRICLKILVLLLFLTSHVHSEPGKKELLSVYFKTNAHSLASVEEVDLAKFVEGIKQTKSRFLVVGHADERGSSQYNLMLGDKRARSVLRCFIEAGLNAERFLVLSKGEVQPIDSSHHSAAWKKNRRVEIFTW